MRRVSAWVHVQRAPSSKKRKIWVEPLLPISGLCASRGDDLSYSQFLVFGTLQGVLAFLQRAVSRARVAAVTRPRICIEAACCEFLHFVVVAWSPSSFLSHYSRHDLDYTI